MRTNRSYRRTHMHPHTHTPTRILCVVIKKLSAGHQEITKERKRGRGRQTLPPRQLQGQRHKCVGHSCKHVWVHLLNNFRHRQLPLDQPGKHVHVPVNHFSCISPQAENIIVELQSGNRRTDNSNVPCSWVFCSLSIVVPPRNASYCVKWPQPKSMLNFLRKWHEFRFRQRARA